MSVVNQAVKDRVGDGGVTDVGMPVFNGELTGNESGASAVIMWSGVKPELLILLQNPLARKFTMENAIKTPSRKIMMLYRRF
jgi:hypothetical protein